MTPSFQFVELDKAVHDRKSFDCGVEELNLFLQQLAARHRAAGISMTMVLPAKENKADICAYYTLSHTETKRQTLPKSVAKEVTSLSDSSDADSATLSEPESSGSRAW